MVDPLEIPYEGITLPGYFYHASKEHINHKNKQYDSKNNNQENDEEKVMDSNETNIGIYTTLLVHGGFDSTLEELYSSTAAPALERGYNCLTFEGTGQGNVIRKQKIPLDMSGKRLLFLHWSL